MGALCRVAVCYSVLWASQVRVALAALPSHDCNQEGETPDLCTPCTVPATKPATSSLLQVSSSSSSSEAGPLLSAIWSLFTSEEHEERVNNQSVPNTSAMNTTAASDAATNATGGDENTSATNTPAASAAVANATGGDENTSATNTTAASAADANVTITTGGDENTSATNTTAASAAAANATTAAGGTEELEASNISQSATNMSTANITAPTSTPRRIQDDEVSNSSQSESNTSLTNSTKPAYTTNATTYSEDGSNSNQSKQSVSNVSASGATAAMSNTTRRVEGYNQSNSSQSAINMSVTNDTDVALNALDRKQVARHAQEDSQDRAKGLSLNVFSVANATNTTNGTNTMNATRCPWKQLSTICTRNTSYYRENLRPSKIPGRSPQPWPSGDSLEQKIKEYALSLSIPYSADAMKDFQALQHLDARDVLAFQETWTEDDTEILLSMDAEPWGFTTGNFSVRKFLEERLPHLSTFRALDFKDSIAIVGAGPSVKGNGNTIDGHPAVARFNNHVGKELNSKDTGQKTTIHVVNRWVKEMLQDPGLAMIMNLECFAPGQEYCRYWHEEGSAPSVVGAGVPVLLIRPSVLCAVPNIIRFTRGFLFYYLAGRLFSQADLYGMAIEDLDSHYAQIKKHVGEPYLQFEHYVYAAAQGLKLEKSMELLRIDLEKKKQEEEKKKLEEARKKNQEKKKEEEKRKAAERAEANQKK